MSRVCARDLASCADGLPALYGRPHRLSARTKATHKGARACRDALYTPLRTPALLSLPGPIRAFGARLPCALGRNCTTHYTLYGASTMTRSRALGSKFQRAIRQDAERQGCGGGANFCPEPLELELDLDLDLGLELG